MEKEWQKIRMELARKMSEFISELADGALACDESVCGLYTESIDLMMADAALLIMRASAEGQQLVRDQEM